MNATAALALCRRCLNMLLDDKKEAKTRDASLCARKAGTMLFVAVLFAALLFLRSWRLFLDPRMNVEDATVLFNFYYGGTQPLVSVVRAHNGYISLIPQLLGWSISHFATQWQPYLYALAPLCLWSGVFAYVSQCDLWRNRVGGMIFASVAALGCFNYTLFYHNIIYSQWTLLLLLMLMTMTGKDDRRRPGALAVKTAAMTLLTCSHPYSIAVAPPMALRLFRARTHSVRMHCATVIGIAVVYFLSMDRNGVDLVSRLRPAAAVDFISITLLAHLRTTASGIAWTQTRLFLVAALLAYLALFALILYMRLQRGRLLQQDWRDATLLYYLAASSFLYLVSTRFDVYGRSPDPRYVFILQQLWLLFLFRITDQALTFFQVGAARRALVYGLCLLMIPLSHCTVFGQKANVPEGSSRRGAIAALCALEDLAEEFPGTVYHYREANDSEWAIDVVVGGAHRP